MTRGGLKKIHLQVVRNNKIAKDSMENVALIGLDIRKGSL